MSKQKQLNINTEEGTVEEQDVVQPKMSRGSILAALKAAFASGDVSKSTIRRMKTDLGFTQADFTRKQTTKKQRKAKRKAQKESRRKNRGLGKGQKQTKGQKTASSYKAK